MKQEVVILGEQTIDQKLRVWQVGAQASKFGFYKLIVCIIKKNCHGVKQKCKNICDLLWENIPFRAKVEKKI